MAEIPSKVVEREIALHVIRRCATRPKAERSLIAQMDAWLDRGYHLRLRPGPGGDSLWAWRGQWPNGEGVKICGKPPSGTASG